MRLWRAGGVLEPPIAAPVLGAVGDTFFDEMLVGAGGALLFFAAAEGGSPEAESDYFYVESAVRAARGGPIRVSELVPPGSVNPIADAIATARGELVAVWGGDSAFRAGVVEGDRLARIRRYAADDAELYAGADGSVAVLDDTRVAIRPAHGRFGPLERLGAPARELAFDPGGGTWVALSGTSLPRRRYAVSREAGTGRSMNHTGTSPGIVASPTTSKPNER